MTRAVLDVNVLVSGFPAERGVPAELIERWAEGTFELVLSDHILAGMERAWGNAYYQTRFSAGQARRALALLRSEATIVVPVTTVRGVGDDEEDDLVLATAVAGGASYLVTGDRALHSLGTYQGITILSPRQFLDLLRQQGEGDDQ